MPKWLAALVALLTLAAKRDREVMPRPENEPTDALKEVTGSEGEYEGR